MRPINNSRPDAFLRNASAIAANRVDAVYHLRTNQMIKKRRGGNKREFYPLLFSWSCTRYSRHGRSLWLKSVSVNEQPSEPSTSFHYSMMNLLRKSVNRKNVLDESTISECNSRRDANAHPLKCARLHGMYQRIAGRRFPETRRRRPKWIRGDFISRDERE